MRDDAFQSLTSLGFTELEAEVYVALLRQSPATGYRVAQSIGRPVANTYKALESLQQKGAVLVDDGANRLCRAVPAEELLAQLERSFQRRRQAAAAALASLRAAPEDDRVYQLQSVEQVFERCRRMLDGCEQAAILDVFPKPLEELRETVEAAARRGVRVTVKAYAPAAVPGADVVVHPQGRATLRRWPGQWLNLVTDGREHLLAFLTPDARGLYQAVWSGSAYLSWVYHSAVGAELILAALLRDLEAGATAADLREAVARYQYLFRADLPGARALLDRFGKRRSTNRTAEDDPA
jgi:sugar-specific transcriptional regulator TrmB